MSADQLREIRASGVTIGSHTMNHPRLAGLSPAHCRRELAGSKAALEDLLGEEVRHLCYPYGSFGTDTLRAAAEIGYLSATTCLRGPVEPGDHALALPRKAISFGDNLIGFVWKLAVKNRPRPQLVEWRRMAMHGERDE
jgi:peptidoglycan/xylan/chitin deacetylase (PgdA/CDA1 family)